MSTSRRAVAFAQLLEALSRLLRAAAICDCEQLECMADCINNAAYHYEQHGTYDAKYAPNNHERLALKEL